MEQQRYEIKGAVYIGDAEAFQEALAASYRGSLRPRCLCVPGGVEMYVAKYKEYVLKRMPDTGPKHHTMCASYECDTQQSGLGELIGEAVIEHSPDLVEIRVAFPLMRKHGRPVANGETEDVAEVTAPRRRMSLRALLHLLWDRAHFNRWYPRMKDRRPWSVLHKYLSAAAADVQLRGTRLTELLYIPEPFTEPRKAAIVQHRNERLAFLSSPENDVQYRMGLILGEFKSAEAGPSGYKMRLKHMADCPLLVETKAWERMHRGFSHVFEALDASTPAPLKIVVCALVFAKREYTYQVDTASFMLVTENWIPIEGVHEVALMNALTEQQRIFLRPLRYDAKSPNHFANALLLDAGAAPLHVISSFMSDQERAAKEKAVARAGGGVWVWRTEQTMPALPTVHLVGHAALPRPPEAIDVETVA